jgi:hypothetical protein
MVRHASWSAITKVWFAHTVHCGLDRQQIGEQNRETTCFERAHSLAEFQNRPSDHAQQPPDDLGGPA